jgi:peroxiredoxin
VYERQKLSGIKLVGIGLLDKKAACREFIQRYHLSFPNAYDGDGKIAKLYGFTYQPYWAVIDRDGTLLTSGFGPANEDALATAIQRLVGK